MSRLNPSAQVFVPSGSYDVGSSLSVDPIINSNVTMVRNERPSRPEGINPTITSSSSANQTTTTSSSSSSSSSNQTDSSSRRRYSPRSATTTTTTTTATTTTKKGSSTSINSNSETQETPKRNGRWWSTIDQDDPITLEPINRLRYPPFPLCPDIEGKKEFWFDAKSLATFLVSTSSFIHPISRRALTRDECQQLDTFVRTHHLHDPVITEVFDTKQDSPSSRVQQLRVRAQVIMETLFADRMRRIDESHLNPEEQDYIAEIASIHWPELVRNSNQNTNQNNSQISNQSIEISFLQRLQTQFQQIQPPSSSSLASSSSSSSNIVTNPTNTTNTSIYLWNPDLIKASQNFSSFLISIESIVTTFLKDSSKKEVAVGIGGVSAQSKKVILEGIAKAYNLQVSQKNSTLILVKNSSSFPLVSPYLSSAVIDYSIYIENIALRVTNTFVVGQKDSETSNDLEQCVNEYISQNNLLSNKILIWSVVNSPCILIKCENKPIMVQLIEYLKRNEKYEFFCNSRIDLS